MLTWVLQSLPTQPVWGSVMTNLKPMYDAGAHSPAAARRRRRRLWKSVPRLLWAEPFWQAGPRLTRLTPQDMRSHVAGEPAAQH